MRIEFTGRREVVAAARVAFEANVDGKDVWCSVSLDALNDHFGNARADRRTISWARSRRTARRSKTRPSGCSKKTAGNRWSSETRGFRQDGAVRSS